MGVIVIVIAIAIVIVIVISIADEAEAEAGKRDVAQVNLQPEIRRNRNGKRRGSTVVNQKKRNGNGKGKPIAVVMTMIRVSEVART